MRKDQGAGREAPEDKRDTVEASQVNDQKVKDPRQLRREFRKIMLRDRRLRWWWLVPNGYWGEILIFAGVAVAFGIAVVICLAIGGGL